MKTSRIIASATLFFAAAYSTNAYAVKTEESQIELRIQFEDSDHYTDIDNDYGRTDKRAESVLKSVKNAFQKSANKYLPDGYILEVVITDIDLAGDRSPLTSTYGDYRVYKSIFPPRINFSYAVYDPSEKLIASGTTRESDIGYTFKFRGPWIRSDEKAPYVTELVRGWASKELRRAVKTQ
ncbi:hypothetical protein VDG1235_3728 [Verrucomicrobiia bacterium DG1235]|nr:hypothetical protein VDG1235_3728 [Verrucomicrobiae bacterium DG1235]